MLLENQPSPTKIVNTKEKMADKDKEIIWLLLHRLVIQGLNVQPWNRRKDVTVEMEAESCMTKKRLQHDKPRDHVSGG